MLNLKALLRKFLTLVQTHREAFGDLTDVNYEVLFRDVSNTVPAGGLNFVLPPCTFAHLPKVHMNKSVKFSTDMGAPIKI